MSTRTHAMEWPVTDEWRREVRDKMRELGVSERGLATRTGAQLVNLKYVLDRAQRSALVPKINAALAAISRVAPAAPDPGTDAIAAVAELQERRDAISADIVRLESGRAAIEERLAEAYEHRAKIDVEIRSKRAER